MRPLRELLKAWLRGFRRRYAAEKRASVLDIGMGVTDGEPSVRVTIGPGKRQEHLAVLGKTGTGKSSLLRYFAQQDIRAGRGFLFFDLHGDTKDFIVRTVAEQEAVLRSDLSDRLVIIDPSDQEFSVGMNPLAHEDGRNRFVEVAEFSEVLRERWQLDVFGARTDELLRNSLSVLADAGLTLLELAPLLADASFRGKCLGSAQNPEVRQYFELRYDPLSDAMQAVMREAILNKTSAFTADPSFRHIIGQQHSTFSLREAMDAGCWVVLDLNKGRLGDHAATLGALFFTAVKNALFSRRDRDLFTVYADEVQNLVAYGGSLETVLSEARKFAISIISANQYLDQYPVEMRSAIQAVGSHLYFQLSSADAQPVATALDGGKALAERLKNLPKRHVVVKSSSERWREAVVPRVQIPSAAPADLYRRSRARWARSRVDIEAEIAARQADIARPRTRSLHDWE